MEFRPQGRLVIVEHVPADVCPNCGHRLLPPGVLTRIEEVLHAQPYISSIAYREFVYQCGEWRWAFGEAVPDAVERLLRLLLPHVRYIGRRGSLIQFLGCETAASLGSDFTARVEQGAAMVIPARSHVMPLDDFGPEASLEVLSSFSEAKAKRDRHRIFADTVVPLGRLRSGAGFTEYRR